MLTSLIRSNTMFGLLLTYVLSVTMVGAIWLFGPTPYSVSELLSTHWAFAWVDQLDWLVPVISIILFAFTGIFSRIRFREIKETLGNRNLSMLAFVSIVVSQSQTLLTRPDVLAASLVLIAVYMLIFFTYKKEGALSEVFHVGLGIGLASLFVGQSILLVGVIAFALLMLRTGNTKEWTVLFLGMVMTAVFVSLFVVWSGAPILSFKRVIQSAWIAQVSISTLTWGHVILISLIALSLSTFLSNITTGTVHLRNITLVNFGWVLGVALMIVILGVDWQVGLVLAAFPLSNLIAQLLQSINRWWLADFLLLLLLVAPILSTLLPL